jgi:maleylpyruvate isomerase
MSHTLDDTLRWMSTGHALLEGTLAGLTDEDVKARSTLPDWTVGQLLAHVAGNAEALSNLVTWARTGVETPMYASPQERDAGIAKGLALSAAELQAWVSGSAAALADGLRELTAEQWDTKVTTVQGRTLPATEIPWLRSREALVHAVDLGRGTTFADLPEGFLDALIADILLKRGDIALPEGPTPEVAAWLAGREHALAGAPELGPWL